MAGTDILTGARFPGSSDSPNVNQDIQNAVNDLSDIVGGIFTTNSARDTAFSTWVSQGNTMRDGLSSRVAGQYQIYRSGSWHGVAPVFYTTSSPADTTTIFTASTTIMTLSVADPLWPAGYRLTLTGSALMAVLGAGVTVAGRLRINGSDLLSGPDIANTSGASASNQLVYIPGSPVSGVMTGACTVTLFIFKSGTAGNGFQVGNNALYNTLTAQVTPA